MTQKLITVATIVLGITIVSDFIAIWGQLAPKDDLLRFTEILLSWKVITGGVVIGAGSAFKDEIKSRLRRTS